ALLRPRGHRRRVGLTPVPLFRRSISPPLTRRLGRTQNLKEETTMRVMVLVKANKDSEAGVLPDEKILTEMGKFNIQLEEAGVMPHEKILGEMAKYHEELQKAGVLLDASGLQATSKGWRIQYSGQKRTVVDGPFTEAKELIAGYTIIQVKSKEEAMEWARRFPNPALNGQEG